MGPRDRSFTVIVAPNSPGRVRQFRISMRRIYGILFCAIILSLLTSYGVFTYFHLVAKLVDFESVLARHNALKEQNLQFRDKTRQLDEKLSQIEMITAHRPPHWHRSGHGPVRHRRHRRIRHRLAGSPGISRPRTWATSTT